MSSDTDQATKVTETVDLISKKWHPVIIQRLLEAGPLRFNELQTTIEDISAKVLTDSLDDLVENRLVERRVISESPRRVEYELTSDGRDLQSAMQALADWGERHLDPDPDPTVLIVDNDPRLVNMHASWLEDEYTVERAYDGEEAFRNLTDDIDVVLLDRRMPGLSGDEVVERVHEWGIDCRIVMLSAVKPDFDLVEMGFDAYIVKPGLREEVRDVITDVLARDMYDEKVQEYLMLSAKRALLRAEKTEVELEASEEYAWLVDRLDRLEEEIDDPAEEAATNAQIRTVLGNES